LGRDFGILKVVRIEFSLMETRFEAKFAQSQCSRSYFSSYVTEIALEGLKLN
jgi:hypothetical protein